MQFTQRSLGSGFQVGAVCSLEVMVVVVVLGSGAGCGQVTQSWPLLLKAQVSNGRAL